MLVALEHLSFSALDRQRHPDDLLRQSARSWAAASTTTRLDFPAVIEALLCPSIVANRPIG
jgi:hypothetical protein